MKFSFVGAPGSESSLAFTFQLLQVVQTAVWLYVHWPGLGEENNLTLLWSLYGECRAAVALYLTPE